LVVQLGKRKIAAVFTNLKTTSHNMFDRAVSGRHENLLRPSMPVAPHAPGPGHSFPRDACDDYFDTLGHAESLAASVFRNFIIPNSSPYIFDA
jgi:hypothetical protein